MLAYPKGTQQSVGTFCHVETNLHCIKPHLLWVHFVTWGHIYINIKLHLAGHGLDMSGSVDTSLNQTDLF